MKERKAREGLKGEVGDNIRLWRTRRRLEPAELAERMHVTAKKVSEWESGANLIRLDTLVAIADALDVSLDLLVRGEAGIVERMERLEQMVKDHDRRIEGSST